MYRLTAPPMSDGSMLCALQRARIEPDCLLIVAGCSGMAAGKQRVHSTEQGGRSVALLAGDFQPRSGRSTKMAWRNVPESRALTSCQERWCTEIDRAQGVSAFERGAPAECGDQGGRDSNVAKKGGRRMAEPHTIARTVEDAPKRIPDTTKRHASDQTRVL